MKWNSTEVLKSNLCDYNDANILVRVDITIIRHLAIEVVLKNYALSSKFITNIDAAMTDDAEDLDLILPMYNLIICSSNYSDTAGSLWFYSKDEATIS